MRAIILGSGLTSFSECFEVVKSVRFESQIEIKYEVLDGHDRKFIWCRFEGEEFLIISGKFHYYEGFSYQELIAPIKFAIEKLGVNEIVVTSASGGLSPKSIIGEWMYVNQVMSLPQVNIDIPAQRKTSFEPNVKSDDSFPTLPRVTYTYHQGPSLGTLAEYKLLNLLGADLVGMSMYPEFNYLKASNIQSHFLSIPVCNYHPFENAVEPSFEQVIEVSSSCIPVLADLFSTYLSSSKSK